MNRINYRIPIKYRAILFTALGGSWCTGLTFYYLNRWVTIESTFGATKHPAQTFVLMAHGASAFLMLMCFGVLLVNHLPAAWRLNRSRYLGLVLTTLIAFQIITAYMLYYIADEESRVFISNLHAASGASIPFFLISHLIIGRKHRK
jgi:hypothetical protein